MQKYLLNLKHLAIFVTLKHKNRFEALINQFVVF